MIGISDKPLGLWLYVYSVRYGYQPSVLKVEDWKGVLKAYKAPPEFGRESKEVLLIKIPVKLLGSITKKELGGVNLKTDFAKDLADREVVLLVNTSDRGSSETLSNFLHKNKSWLYMLEDNPPEITALYSILKKVFTHDAFDWLMLKYKNSPMRIKEELKWWAYKFNTNKQLLGIDEIRRDMGEFEANTERYCYYLGKPRGNEILRNMKSSDIWSTFFSINEYKSPVDMYIQKNCPSLGLSLCLFKYAVNNGFIGVREGAIILNSWWVSVIDSRKSKPWTTKECHELVDQLRHSMRLVL